MIKLLFGEWQLVNSPTYVVVIDLTSNILILLERKKMVLFLFTILMLTTLAAQVSGSLFGADKSCNVLTPTNPDCCFMTDKDDSKSQSLQGAQPLHSSPFIMNLVQLNNQKSLNRLKARSFKGNQLYELTPLKEDPEDPSQQIEGGPVRIQVRLWMKYQSFLDFYF